MEASITIRKLFAENKIEVPTSQRGYSWETPNEKMVGKRIRMCVLSDLGEYNESNAKTPYYYGHFLFEKKTSEI